MGLFGKLNVEKKVKETEKQQNFADFGGDINFFDLQKGNNRIRFLPPIKEYPDYEFKTYRHYNVGNEGKQSVLCPKKTFNNKFRCPICEMSNKLYKSENSDDKELAKNLFAVERNFANIINLDEDADPKSVYVFTYGFKISNGLIKKISDPDYGDITDLETGFNINIEKDINKGGKPEYTIDVKKQCPAPNFDEKQVVVLNKIYKTCLTYEALQMVLEGDSVVSAIEAHGLINVETGEVEKPNTKKSVKGNEEEPQSKTKVKVEEPKQNKNKKIEEEEDLPDTSTEDDEPIMEKNFKKPTTKRQIEEDDNTTIKTKIDESEKVKPNVDDDEDDILAQLKARKAKMQK